MLIGILASCVTLSDPPKVHINPECPAPILDNYSSEVNSPEVDKEFQENVGYAQQVCIRYYGPRACLIYLIRLAPRSYHAMCRKG